LYSLFVTIFGKKKYLPCHKVIDEIQGLMFFFLNLLLKDTTGKVSLLLY